jgi:5,10-methylenetetrahydromethanopterin reductase
MPAVTNPISRDPSVTAAALFTLSELAPGRVALGIGTGDSAAWGVGKKPARLDQLREYMLAVRALLHGEEAHYEGRVMCARWAGFSPPVWIPMIVAVAGPKIIRMSCEIADGMLVSMGFGTENIDYVRSLVDEGCRAAGRDPSELELWWATEIVFGDSVEDARARGMGVSTEWLTMGSLEGKQIPEELQDALRTFNSDAHDLQAEYQAEGREQALIVRAKELGLYEWLLSRAAGLWGTPADIAARLNHFGEMGLDKWIFYIGRSEKDRMTDLHKLCDEVLPLLRGR